jgi:hypothetical protein
MDLSMPAGTPAPTPRRLIAAGIISRRAGRTVQITRTEHGTRGSIRPAGGAR